MVKRITENPPCAGSFEGDGCSNFEGYFSREWFAIQGAADTGQSDARIELLDDPDGLRKVLHREFVAGGYCELSQVDLGTDVDKAVSIRRPVGCEVALGKVENSRLFPEGTMYYLLKRSLRPISAPDGIITQCFEREDPAFDRRLRSHRQILDDEDADVCDRLVSAGALLFNFHDIDSLDLTERLLDYRMDALIEDPVLKAKMHVDGMLTEWIAWRKILVALSFYGKLTEDTVEKFFQATLLDKASFTEDHAERALEDSYHTMIDILKREAGLNKSPNSRRMQKAAKNTAEMLISVFARSKGIDPEEVVSNFRRQPKRSNTLRCVGQLTLEL